MAKEDGGVAFPHNEKNELGSHWVSHPGMSLRDWFAGQAMLGIPFNHGLTHAESAERCYAFADAMLAASTATEKNNG